MGKSALNKYKRYDYEDEEEYSSSSNYLEKKRKKRVNQALKTKNIDILIEIDNEGIDPIDYEEDVEDNLEYMKVEWK
jgi:hypothetical protein